MSLPFSSAAKVTLSSSDDLRSVKFDFGPEKITYSRQGRLNNRFSGSRNGRFPLQGATNASTTNTQAPQITLNDLVVYGTDTKERCDRLIEWLSPLQERRQRTRGVESTAPQKILFSWGTGFRIPVAIANMTVNYTRFDSLGHPTRARVTLVLRQEPRQQTGTNPTSGGLPMRRRHMVGEGDSLAAISHDTYGSPKHWRAVAAQNAVDDPLRVRPGRALYLPNADELEG